MGPAERRDVRQQVGGTVQTGLVTTGNGMAEMFGVPIDDDGGEQVQPGHPEVLSFAGAVADFALTADAQGVFQSMMRLALVETDLGAALHVGVEQPVDDEQRPLDPSYFPQRHSEFMLSGIGCEFPQQLARRHGSCRHGGRAAQDVGPVCRDEGFLDLAADQPLQLFRAGGRIEEIQAL